MERSQVEPRRATGYRRGTTSTLWLKTSGRSAITLASGISAPRKSGVSTSILVLRRLASDLPDDADEGCRPVVGEVVAVDAGDDRVPESHLGHRARHPGGLERIVPGRLAGLDVAEPAAARAGVAEDHERGRAPLPALADVRARRLLADRVQVLLLDEALQLPVARAAGRRDLEPRRLAAPVGLDVGPENGQHVGDSTGVGPGSRRMFPFRHRVKATARAIVTHAARFSRHDRGDGDEGVA